MLRVLESGDRMEITSPMPAGRRLAFLVLALVPLLAPYQLLVAPDWVNILNPFFAFAALVSLGALAVTVFLVWAAIAGIESTARFDRKRRTLTAVAKAPVMPLQTHTYPLDDLRTIQIETTDWSDGGPSYTLRIDTADGRAFKLLAGFQKTEVEEIRSRITRFLSAPSAG